MGILLTRRRALDTALVGLAGLVAVSGCSGEGDETPTAVPGTWTTNSIDPLSYAIPEGMKVWYQESGSSQFYWDRCWSTNTKDNPASDLLLVRLWGEGAANDASAADALDSLRNINGVVVAAGDVTKVSKLGDGSTRQDLAGKGAEGTLAPESPQATAFKGALWDVTNGVSRALILLIGPSVTEKMIATVELGIKFAKQTALGNVPEGWQQRQVGGVSYAVPTGSNDVVLEGDYIWTAAYTVRTSEDMRTASVAVAAKVKGSSLNAAADAIMAGNDAKNVADGSASDVALSDGTSALRFDYTFGGGKYRSALLVAKIGSETYGVDVRDFGMTDENFATSVETVLASMRAA